MRMPASLLASLILTTVAVAPTVARADDGAAIAAQLAAPELERLRLHPELELRARAAEVVARTDEWLAATKAAVRDDRRAAAKGKRTKASVRKAHDARISAAADRRAQAVQAHERARAVVAWLTSSGDCPMCGMG